jgi:hypothetical protein
MAGVQGRGLQALLGHKDGRMTARYSHLSDSYLRRAVDGLNLGVRSAQATSHTPAMAAENGTYLAPAFRASEKS